MTQVLFDDLAPVAVLVVLGAVAGPRLDIDVGSLFRLAYWVFGPAFVFSLLAEADLAPSLIVRLVVPGVAGPRSRGADADHQPARPGDRGPRTRTTSCPTGSPRRWC